MPEFRETYASPGLRWGIFVEDHPGAVCVFEERLGLDAGVPENWGGDKAGVTCMIVVDGEVVAAGWKELEGKKDPENWEKCCTKAQGRALKRAGYPSDTRDLKALVLWRQRKAELAQLQAGYAPKELASVDAALDAAANGDEDDDEVVDGEVIDTQENSETPSGNTTPREEVASPDSALSTPAIEKHGIDGGAGSVSGEAADPQPSLDDVVGPRDRLAARVRALPQDKRALFLRDRKNHVPPLPPINLCDDAQLDLVEQIVAFWEHEVETEKAEANA